MKAATYCSSCWSDNTLLVLDTMEKKSSVYDCTVEDVEYIYNKFT